MNIEQIKNLIKKTNLPRAYIFMQRLIQNPADRQYFKVKASTLPKADGFVLFAHESEQLGASLLLLNIAKEMKKQGYHIYILTRYAGPLNEEYSRVADLTLVTSEGNCDKTLRTLYEKGYRYFISNSSVNHRAATYAKRNGYKVLGLVNETPWMMEQNGTTDQYLNYVNNADVLIFPTRDTKDSVQKYLGLGRDSMCKVCIRPQGIYLGMGNESEREENRAKIKALLKDAHSDAKKLIVGLGNCSERKGIDIFIELARKAGEPYLFLWAGGETEYYRKNFSEQDLPENYIYLGELSPKLCGGLYDMADFLLLSSRADTFPSVMLEAMQYGVPVAGFAESGGIKELVVDGENGVLIDTIEQKDELLGKMLESMSNDAKYEEMSHNAKETSKKYGFAEYVGYLVKEVCSVPTSEL